MNKLLAVAFAGLLLLAGCGADFTAPDGMQVYGPEVQAEGSTLAHTLKYSVIGFKAHHQSSLAFLQSVATSGVVSDDQAGTYKVIFIDQVTGQVITEIEITSESDILGIKRIHPQR
jgi:hypothetical protein